MPSNAEALREMPDEYVVCRMLKHNWNLLGFYNSKTSTGRVVVVMSLECGLCEMTREDYLDRTGNLMSRFYGAPAGYNVKRDKGEKREGRIYVQDSRAEMLSRTTVYQSASTMRRARNGRA